MTTDHTREALAELLNQHRPIDDSRGETKGCTCGLSFGIQHQANRSYESHLLDLLADHLAALVEGRDAKHAECDRLKEEYHEQWMLTARDLAEARAALAVERENVATAIEDARDTLNLDPATRAGMTRAARIARSSTDGGDTDG